METVDLYRRAEEALEQYAGHMCTLAAQTQQAEVIISRAQKVLSLGETKYVRLSELEQTITERQAGLDALGRDLVSNLDMLGKEVSRESQVLSDRIELVRLSSREQMQHEAVAREQMRSELTACIHSLQAGSKRTAKIIWLLGWSLAATWIVLVGIICLLI